MPAPGHAALRRFLDQQPSCVAVEVVAALGSTPREAGAWMLVSPGATFGTIGGGRLEFMAIEQARKMLGAAGGEATRLDVALGPEIGQCCGGRVELSIRVAHEPQRERLLADAAAEEEAWPRVYLFGGGHVGNALAATLALLPLRTSLVETRAEALEGAPPGVTPLLTAVPETVVRQASPGSAFAVLTHDHALDFLLVAEALKRGDAAYVGMIGSRTKRATFRSWFLREAEGSETDLSRLVCPIGGTTADKRPAVIAALAAAEIMRAAVAGAGRDREAR